MQSDVTQIKRSGEFVTMPLSVYEELRAFCRVHGETDLPGFAEFVFVEYEPVEATFVDVNTSHISKIHANKSSSPRT